nr:MAG TPA: hypothetical protein [Caudoviricetes sp.]
MCRRKFIDYSYFYKNVNDYITTRLFIIYSYFYNKNLPCGRKCFFTSEWEVI